MTPCLLRRKIIINFLQIDYDFLRRLYMDNSVTKFGYAFYLSYGL